VDLGALSHRQEKRWTNSSKNRFPDPSRENTCTNELIITYFQINGNKSCRTRLGLEKAGKRKTWRCEGRSYNK
jgi:uncharacterized protein